MKKYRIIINITNDFLAFWLSYCTYIGVFSLVTLSQLILPTKIAVIRIEKNITFQKIIKRGLMKDMTNFLQVPNKLSSKKKR